MAKRQSAVENLVGMGTLAQFWAGRNVLLTGHTGFKGAWLAEILSGFGANVTGLALQPPSAPNLFDLLQLKDRITHIEGDIRDEKLVAQVIQQVQPEIILHLAAQSLVRPSYAEPVETFATNISGTVHVLEAARHCAATRAVLVVTSDKCYANEGTGRHFTETDKLGGNDPYSASKAAAEIVAHAYDTSFFRQQGIAMATARAGNVIGGGDWATDRLIPDAFRAYSAQQPVVIRYPDATRPWQHVLEPLHGYMLLAQKLVEQNTHFSGGWNFGPERDGIGKVRDVLARLQQSFPFEITVDPGEQLHEAKTLGLTIDKAKAELGWQPRLSTDEAIGWTGDWYKAYSEGADPVALTRRQIHDYMARA